jgi:hypothetical protein
MVIGSQMLEVEVPGLLALLKVAVPVPVLEPPLNVYVWPAFAI